MTLLTLLIFLAFGSYLNSLAYRLLNLDLFFKIRSFCPACKQIIAWYDNIPVISWILLKARCRSCKLPISWLYPFIEILTPVVLFALWRTVNLQYFYAYFLFFSALLITIRTDFDQMLISRFATLYLIPLAILATMMHALPITWQESIIGTIFGYGLLFVTQKISFYMTHQQALGQGDLELLAFIGACTGPVGCWVSLMIGSVLGTACSLIYMAISKRIMKLIPLGAYLSFGAIIFVLWQDFFLRLYRI